MTTRRTTLCGGAALAIAIAAGPAQADSVAQVATAKRISRQTVSLLDPQGRPSGTTGSDTVVQPGTQLLGATRIGGRCSRRRRSTCWRGRRP